MSMTTTVSLRFEGPNSCADCQRAGIPLCDHIGFNAEAWDSLPGKGITVPGLDPAYEHVVQGYVISADRKTLTLTVVTARPAFHDLARHLSMLPDVRAKASVRAVHHETGAVLEEGAYDRFLTEGMQVAIDRDLFHVRKVEHPYRNEHGMAPGPEGDVQVAHLAPAPMPAVQIPGVPGPDEGAL
jgi:hypothetical protein